MFTDISFFPFHFSHIKESKQIYINCVYYHIAPKTLEDYKKKVFLLTCSF